MTEKLFKIDTEVIKKSSEETPFAGLIPFVQMCEGMKLGEIIDKSLDVRGGRGYKDSEHVMSLITMQIVEGQTIDDLATFKEKFGMEAIPFRIPSPSAERDFLAEFHNSD
jgi:hypothetical protein